MFVHLNEREDRHDLEDARTPATVPAPAPALADPLVPLAMIQHPRTPGSFWDAIGWQDQIDNASPIYNCGPALRWLRMTADIGQRELARRMGVSLSLIQKWEYGESPIPRRHVEAIETACGGILDMRAHNFGTQAA